MTKIQIRENVFETNSSSSHSLTITKDDMLIHNFPDEELSNGQVNILLKSFGWEQERLYTPSNKASYMLADCLDDDFKKTLSGRDGSFENLRDSIVENSSRGALVIEAIEAHTGCEVFIQGGDCYVDHQSVGTSYQIPEEIDDITHFLFSNSCITLGNDNRDDPVVITNDLASGSEPFGPTRRESWDNTYDDDEPQAPGL